MARPNINELISVQDPLQTWNWSLTIPNIPGSSLARDITLKCQSANLPGSSVEQVSVEAHGVKLNFAGRRQWSGTWEATFFESRSASTRTAFVNWMELQRSWANNSGAYKDQYAVTAEISQYDDKPKEVKNVRLRGLFPMTIADVSLDQTSGVVIYSITFSFDYAEDF